MKFLKGVLLCLIPCVLLLTRTVGAVPITVYTDSLAPGWNDTSYGTVRNYCASPLADGYQQGSCALSVQFMSPWSGWSITRTGSGVGTSGQNALSFLMHGTLSPATPEVYVTLFGNNGIRLGSVLVSAYIPGGLISPNWHRIEIPLVDFGIQPGSSTLITTINIESNMATTLYFDDMKFTSVSVPDQSIAYQENPTISSTPRVNFTFGWRDTSYGSWAGTRNFNSPVHLNGDTGIQVYHPSAWTGFSLTNSFGVDTRGKNTLSFAINGGSTGGQDLYVVLGSSTSPSLGIQPLLNYIPGHNMIANQWYQVNIPLADLGGVNKVINRISIESATSTVVYYDDVRIGYQDPYSFYNDGVGAKWRGDTYGANALYVAPIGGKVPFSDTLGIRVDYNMVWGGLYISDFATGGGVNTEGKQSVVMAINGGPTGGQDVYLSLYGANTSATLGSVRIANYLYNPSTNTKYPNGTLLAPNQWYDVVIPLWDLSAANTMVTRIGLECDCVASVWYDDIRIGGFLRFPLANQTPESAGINAVMDHDAPDPDILNNIVVGYTGEKGDKLFGSNDRCYGRENNQRFLVNGNYVAGGCGTQAFLSYDSHVGTDYQATFGTSVYATASGYIREVDCPTNVNLSCVGLGTEYGTFTIDHGNGYFSRYLHLSSQAGGLTTGMYVTQGQLIGKVGHTVPVPGPAVGDHLHFEVRKDGFNIDVNRTVDPYGWQGVGSFTDPYTAAPSTIRLWR